MKKLLFPIIILCLLLAACSSDNSKPTPAALPTQTSIAAAATSTPVADTLTNRLEQYMQTKKPSFSGTILVMQKGEILLNQGYGFANHEWDIPNTPQTKFAIGSMSKAFTALAIMMLQERGELSVQDSICDYLSDCPEAWQPITLHHLLTHTSGIFNFTDLDPQAIGDVNICLEYKPEEVIAYFKDLPLDFEPGSNWSYSNSGYFLLGVVIEKVSTESYETFIQKNILQPLGMADSGYDRSSTIVKQRAKGYSGYSGRLSNADCWDVSLKYAAGGLYSTVGDLYKWDQALYTSPLVSSDTLNTLFTSSDGILGGGEAYAYGWFISKRFGHRVIEHAGGVYGFSSQIARFPDDDLTVIVLSNTDFEDSVSISAGLAWIVFEGK